MARSKSKHKIKKLRWKRRGQRRAKAKTRPSSASE